MNYRLIATEVGDLVKWDTSINEILRVAKALFRFNIEEFPNDAITSSRAQTVYNCILSLAKQKMSNATRNRNRNRKSDIYENYRRILRKRDLTNREIDGMRKHLSLLARIICEHVWKKKFY